MKLNVCKIALLLFETIILVCSDNNFDTDCSRYTTCRQLLNDVDSEQTRRMWYCGLCRVNDGPEFSTTESKCRKRHGAFFRSSCPPAISKCFETQRWLSYDAKELRSYETRKMTIHGDFPLTYDYRIKICGSECRDVGRSGYGAQISLTCVSAPPYPLLGPSSTSSQPSCGVELLVVDASDSSILTTRRPVSCGDPMQLPAINPPVDQSDKSAWYALAGVICCLSVILVGVGYIVWRVRMQRAKKMQRRRPEFVLPMSVRIDAIPNDDNVQPRSRIENAERIRPISHGNYEPLSHLVPSKLLIQNESIELERLVGRGHFGQVFKAMYKPPDAQLSIQVAVKTLLCKENARQFLQEGMIMEMFDHENVLSLIGISFEADNLPMIITPFMTKGDLLTYIRHPQNSPDMNQLLTFGLEIAAGMQYLHNSKFIHRDLAARNCMLDENLRVKVADFGLSRDVYETEDYLSSQSMELPIRWMPPESIELKVYSYKSDVWSDGVVLRELCTRGKMPYAGRSGFEVLSFLNSGHRLERFDTTPEEADYLMRTCWMLAPEERPDFPTLVDRLLEVIDRLKSTVLRVPPYYNTTT